MGKIVDKLPVGVALTTLKGRILRMNPEGISLLGLQEDKLGSINVRDLYADPDTDRPRVWDVKDGKTSACCDLGLLVHRKVVLFCTRSRIYSNGSNAVLVTAFWRKGD